MCLISMVIWLLLSCWAWNVAFKQRLSSKKCVHATCQLMQQLPAQRTLIESCCFLVTHKLCAPWTLQLKGGIEERGWGKTRSVSMVTSFEYAQVFDGGVGGAKAVTVSKWCMKFKTSQCIFTYDCSCFFSLIGPETLGFSYNQNKLKINTGSFSFFTLRLLQPRPPDKIFYKFYE